VILKDIFTVDDFEKFTKPPMINLTCSEHVVNVTWSPFEDQTLEKIQDRIQNCQASIECTNTNNEKVFKKQVIFATMLNIHYYYYCYYYCVEWMSTFHFNWTEWWMGMETL